MKKKIFLAVYLCCGMFAAMAQTAADSLAIVSATWQTEPLQKGMLYKKAVFSSALRGLKIDRMRRGKGVSF